MKCVRSRRNSFVARRGVAIAAVATLVLAACGGGDDDSADSTTTTLAVATTTTLAAAATTTVAPATTTTEVTVPEFVTEGATVVVANSSTINGAAGRLSERLAVAGFTMGDPTNGSEGQLEITKIYVDPDDADAEAVAESVRLALGVGDIELFELGVPAPVESGDVGDATVVVSMGNDVADVPLEVLQGTAPATDSTDADDDSGDADDADDDTTDTTEPSDDG